MAWTCQDVTLRLRRELDDPSLLVRFDRDRERFVVCQKTKRVTGRRRHGFSLADDGTVLPSATCTMREVIDDYEPVYYHEASDGGFLPLEPNIMRLEVLARDNRQGNVATRMLRRVREMRAARARQFDDDVGQIAKDTRRTFARYADEIGA